MMETLVYTGHGNILPPLELVCLRGTLKGKRFSLLQGIQTYGRDSGNQIIFDCPTISKNHGMIAYEEDGEIRIYDIHSKNGIASPGKKKSKREFLITLKVDQVIHIGSLVFRLVEEGSQNTSENKKTFSSQTLKTNLFLLLLATSLSLSLVEGSKFFPKRSETLLAEDRSGFKALPVIQDFVGEKSVSSKPMKKALEPAQHIVQNTPKKNKLSHEPKQDVAHDDLQDQAQASFANGQFEQAYQLWQQILHQDPLNLKAQEGIKTLQEISALPSSSQSNPQGGV